MDPADIRVTELDHIVLKCRDVETTLAWYRDRLGLEGVRVEAWRAGDAPFPSVRIDAATIIDLIPGEEPDGRLDHICLVIQPTDMQQLVDTGGFDVLEGPVHRFGARGTGLSVYVRDPDGLTVELRCYP